MASGFPCSQAESTPACHAPRTQTVTQLREFGNHSIPIFTKQNVRSIINAILDHCIGRHLQIGNFRIMNKIQGKKHIMKPSEQIDELIAGINDWRGKMLANLRKIIHDADPEIIEEWKWMGSPCWSHDGLICVANAHKDKVKLTFSQGASLPDPDKLFNAGLEGNKWRAIDLYEGDKINERSLKSLIRSAVAHNLAKKSTK